MVIFPHNIRFLEEFLEEIGGRYFNLVCDEIGLAIPSAYSAYLAHTGRRGCVMLIDGDNSFNPYLVTHYSRLFSLDEKRVMGGIQLSRAFTCHQMSALLGERLESAIARFGAEVVIISDPALPYIERSAEEDVIEEFQTAINRLFKTTYSHRLTTLIIRSNRVPHFLEGGSVEDGKRERTARCAERTLSRAADAIYRLEERTGDISIDRLKHPLLPKGPIVLIPGARRPANLDDALASYRDPRESPSPRIRKALYSRHLTYWSGGREWSRDCQH
jgi:hypothetical protein